MEGIAQVDPQPLPVFTRVLQAEVLLLKEVEGLAHLYKRDTQWGNWHLNLQRLKCIGGRCNSVFTQGTRRHFPGRG